MTVPTKMLKPLTLGIIVIFQLIKHCDSLNSRHKDQEQRIQSIIGDINNSDHIVTKRETVSNQDSVKSSVFPLNNSHLHLMVHWAGRGSSIVFCLARDQKITNSSTSHVFISYDYGTSFTDIRSKFVLSSGQPATITKFFHHPDDNCYYVFTDTKNRMIFVTRDCGETLTSYSVSFSPAHIEFDKNNLARFVVHDRDSDKMELYVTDNFGETFNHASDYVKAFYWHYDENFTELFVSRMEPSGKLNILSSVSFFENHLDTSIVYHGAEQFEKKEDYLFIVKQDKENIESKRLFIAKAGQMFVEAKFSTKLPLRDFHICEVSKDEQILIVVNHSPNKSNLYISDRINLHQAEFSLSLSNIMYYSPGLTWRNSWLKHAESGDEDNFADLYRVSGLRGVYIASQVTDNVTEDSIQPSNIVTLITFDGGAEWSRVTGPNNDTNGHPVAGCQENGCSLHIAQMMSRKYPGTRSIPILTSSSSPGVILSSASVGHTLSHKTNVFISADAGLSWRQVLQGNYYYNMGDHGGVIVAVKYFKTEGPTNTLEYSIDEGLTWHKHQFYDEPLRIFGLITEPGENTTIFTMFGSKQDSKGHTIDWIIIKVDLSGVFHRKCEIEDYKHWSPRGPGVKCIMGVRESYLRRSPRTNCYNGHDFTRSTLEERCPCDQHDYQCDFGFIRENERQGADCVRDPMFSSDNGYHDQRPALCPPDTYYSVSRGYVKVPGDRCEGGKESVYSPQNRSCPIDMKNPGTFMLISTRKNIVKLDLSNPDSQLETLPLPDIKNVIAMDLDYKNDCVFWADIELDIIMKQCVGNGSAAEVLVGGNLNSVEGMAYNHLDQILYFVDGNKKTIEFVKVNEDREGRMRKTILDGNILGKPRGITIHPSQSLLFYSDWADKAACIGSSRLDGSDHKKIISTDENNQQILGWPNGLTIDFDVTPARLYFVDAQKDFIASCRLDGSGFKKLIEQKTHTAHPFGIALYKNLVVWNDWTGKAIYQMDKVTGGAVQVVKDNMHGAMDLKIYTSRLLEDEKTGCDDNQCSHVCISLPPSDPNKYKCLCPDGMKVDSNDQTQCQCPAGQLTHSNGTCSLAPGQNCTGDQFQCSNQLCVSRMWTCDGDNDCGDHSDEHHCNLHQECSLPGKFSCATGKCIPDHWVCDYEDDCGDGSDEAQCPDLDCTDSTTKFQCDSGQCINKSWRCDNEKDCQDGSDELNCSGEVDTDTCDPELHLVCGDQCLPATWRCDGDPDCPDGSDEKECPEAAQCHEWQFKCDDGHCLFANWECDGDVDCADASDEHENCDNVTNNNPKIPALPPSFPRGDCNEWMFKCASDQCIPYWWKCDKVADCDDGSDELDCGTDHKIHDNDNHDNSDKTPDIPSIQGCPTGKFQCNSGDCIWTGWVCDGQDDCGQGEDELQQTCDNIIRCNQTQWQCKLSAMCIDIHQVCDKHNDCDDGTDENNCYDNTNNNTDDEDECEGLICDMGHQCLDWSTKCDGHLDCLDGSDEDYCDLWQEDMIIAGLDLKAVLSTHNSLTVTWWLTDLGRKNVEYKYGWSYHGHNIWNNISNTWSPADRQTYVFSSLSPATDYDLRVYVRDSDTRHESGHAPVVRGRTSDYIPSCPGLITSHQQGSHLVLTWTWPPVTNGVITSYDVNIYQSDTDQLIRQYNIPVPADHNTEKMNTTVSGLQYEVKYQIEVIPVNSMYKAEDCDKSDVMLVDTVRSLHIGNIEERSVGLTWECDNVGVQYQVCYMSHNPLEAGQVCKLTDNKFITLSGFSPATKYRISVHVQTEVQSKSHPKSIEFTTKGSQLPKPTNVQAALHDSNSPTAVKLSWEISPHKDYQYGVWYGVSMDKLLNFQPTLIRDNKIIIYQTEGCSDYIFVVAIFDEERFGVGPGSDPVHVTTRYSDTSPPRHVTRSDNNTVTWSSPCDEMPAPVRYHLTMVTSDIYNESRADTDHITLDPTDKLTMSHTLDNIPAGSMVQVTVKTDQSPDSSPVTIFGPPLPAPTQVYYHTAANDSSKFIVSWAPVEGAASYSLVLSPDSTFSNISCQITFPDITDTMYTIDPSQFYHLGPQCDDVHQYNVGVRSEVRANHHHKYKSAFSRAGNMIMTVNVEEPGTIVIPESSAVGTVVAVLIVLIIMAGGIGYYAYTNRRMRYRFRELIASHYSSATDHATINHHGLMMDDDEDDDSPIIRGFNDKEPLVA